MCKLKTDTADTGVEILGGGHGPCPPPFLTGFLVWIYRVFIKYCVFSPKILKYSGLWPFSALLRCQCVYTNKTGRKPALAAELAEFRKIQNFKEITQYLMNTL